VIYTFYSFKGGVGRSMALANIAELLYRRGLKVLMIDFDLEAPGLEHYFNNPSAIFSQVEILEKRGLIDLLLSYKELRILPRITPSSQLLTNREESKQTFPFPVEPLANFCIPIYEKNIDGGELFLISAGRRSRDSFTSYAEAVQSFDWEKFYSDWHGEEFFDWFRQESGAFADVVLLDSRTGVTEMGGICTHHLADAVVMFVASNQQNLDGTLMMANSLSNTNLILEGRKGRELHLLFVPSRIEIYEAESLDEFAVLFKQMLNVFLPPILNQSSEDNLFNDLKIPYIPYYSYHERVATREAERASTADLLEAFRRLTAILAELSPKDSRFYSYFAEQKKLLIPQNIPRSGVIKFVGRDEMLNKLQQQIQKNNRLAITAIQGMGGIGKTELALQYAIGSLAKSVYPGGICWLHARSQEIATQIVNFAKANLEMKLSDEMEVHEQVTFIWQRWPIDSTLIVIDDVTDYNAIVPCLPPSDPRFKVLITTRQNFGASVTTINIEELSDEEAIALLASFVGEERIQLQLNDVKALCQRIGNLPLGLELLGRFLARKLDWTVSELLEQLASKNLAAKPLITPEPGMTAQLGVAEALELSWQELNEPEQSLACLLGLFAAAPITWELVEQCFSEIDPDELEEIRDEGLIDRSLLKRVGEGAYQFHQIVHGYFRGKLSQRSDQGQGLKEAFCRVMVEIAQSIDETPTIDQVEGVRRAIIHLEEVANHWSESLRDEVLIWPTLGIGRFYEGQGNYKLALPWYQKCLEQCQLRFGSEHPDVALSFNNLAALYDSQGRYEAAEPLYQQALEISRKLLGTEHPEVALSLNNLAELYRNQGRYKAAEPLYQQALEISRKLLGTEHPEVALSLNNLAELYRNQGRYEEAEPLYQQALEISRKLLGTKHPEVALSLNNLAELYRNQGRYEEAEPLYQQALEMNWKLLGTEHPEVASCLNNLAALYFSQERYAEAKQLYQQALEMNWKLLGTEHPDVASCLNNLAALYRREGRYEEAKQLYQQALEMSRKLLGTEHPYVASSLNNLALLYSSQGRYKDAEELYIQALEMRHNLLGTEHPDVATSLLNLGTLHQQQGNYSQAEYLYRRALDIANFKLGPNHPNTLIILEWLGSLP
jgi:tetratricopeptide (TPR) repeat protein